MMTQNLIYTALEKKYEAQVAEARATLEIYFNNAVGIGEHPQMLEEMDKYVEQMAAANDKLANLELVFGKYSQENQVM
jgi:hypothetical protein